eukprot:m.26011 g.26011  ORF g.26011 m.26011 type:complete len:105 (-) comp9964_c0_seq1:202-516(-)
MQLWARRWQLAVLSVQLSTLSSQARRNGPCVAVTFASVLSQSFFACFSSSEKDGNRVLFVTYSPARQKKLSSIFFFVSSRLTPIIISMHKHEKQDVLSSVFYSR